MQISIPTGTRFGRLAVLSEVEPRLYPCGREARVFTCQCDCGAEKTFLLPQLRSGRTSSCGCLARESKATARLKHGDKRKNEKPAPEYVAWSAMKARCENPKHRFLKNYGGRGIKVCDRWRENYEAFLVDVGRKPSSGHTIDRIENDRDYEPGNVRWATRTEQQRNKRNNLLVTFRGEEMPLARACEITGIRYQTAWGRLDRGMSLTEALAP